MKNEAVFNNENMSQTKRAKRKNKKVSLSTMT